MELLNHNMSDEYRWEIYKRQELLSDSVCNSHTSSFMYPFHWLWRGFIHLLVDELVDQEQQVEYLERCRSLDEFGKGDKSPSSSLHRLWLLMN